MLKGKKGTRLYTQFWRTVMEDVDMFLPTSWKRNASKTVTKLFICIWFFFVCGNAVLANSEILEQIFTTAVPRPTGKVPCVHLVSVFCRFSMGGLEILWGIQEIRQYLYRVPSLWFLEYFCSNCQDCRSFLSRRIFTKSVSLELSKDKYSSGGALLKIRQLNYSFAVHSERNCSNWMFYVSFSPRSGKVGTSCSVGVVLRK